MPGRTGVARPFGPLDMAKLNRMPARLGRSPARLKAPPKRADGFYLSPEWRALRAAKLAQGRASCCVCGAGGRGVKLILDHRAERRDGGADLPSLDELDWYCVADHNRKTAAARAARVRQG